MGQCLSPSKSSHVLGRYSMLRLVAGPAANAALANYQQVARDQALDVGTRHIHVEVTWNPRAIRL